MKTETVDVVRTFRKLHETGCFVLPNPWDLGSTKCLQHVGATDSLPQSRHGWSDATKIALSECSTSSSLPRRTTPATGFLPEWQIRSCTTHQEHTKRRASCRPLGASPVPMSYE